MAVPMKFFVFVLVLTTSNVFLLEATASALPANEKFSTIESTYQSLDPQKRKEAENWLQETPLRTVFPSFQNLLLDPKLYIEFQLANLNKTFNATINGHVKGLTNLVLEVKDQLLEKIKQNNNSFVQLQNQTKNLVATVKSNKEALQNEINEKTLDLIKRLIDQKEELQSQLLKQKENLESQFKENIDALNQKLEEQNEKLTQNLKDQDESFQQKLDANQLFNAANVKDLKNEFNVEILKQKVDVSEQLAELKSSLETSISSSEQQFKELLKNQLDDLKNEISDTSESVRSELQTFVNLTVEKVEKQIDSLEQRYNARFP